MDTIEETIKQQLDGYSLDYEQRQVAEQVIVALTERENQIAETLFNSAVAQGLDPHVVRSEMEQAGIQFRVPALHSVEDEDLDAKISRMLDERVAQWQRELGMGN